jgi:hypothetical protein
MASALSGVPPGYDRLWAVPQEVMDAAPWPAAQPTSVRHLIIVPLHDGKIGKPLADIVFFDQPVTVPWPSRNMWTRGPSESGTAPA